MHFACIEHMCVMLLLYSRLTSASHNLPNLEANIADNTNPINDANIINGINLKGILALKITVNSSTLKKLKQMMAKKFLAFLAIIHISLIAVEARIAFLEYVRILKMLIMLV